MKKIKLSTVFILLLFNSWCFSQVKVTIKDMTSNNERPIPTNGPIQIIENKNVRLSINLELTRPLNQVVNGTLKIYTKRSTNDFSAIGVTGGDLTVTNAMWNNTSFGAVKSVTIPASNFNRTGGVFYAQFESTSGINYKSKEWKVSVIRNGDPTPPTSGSPVNRLYSASTLGADGRYNSFFNDYLPFDGSEKLIIPEGGEIKLALRYHIFFPPGFNCNNSTVKLYTRDGLGSPKLLKIEGPQAGIGNIFNKGCAPDIFFRLAPTIKAELFQKNKIGSLYCEIKNKNGRAISRSLYIEVVKIPPIINNKIGNNQTIIENKKGAIIGRNYIPYHRSALGNDRFEGDFRYEWLRKFSHNSLFHKVYGANQYYFDPGTIRATAQYRRVAYSYGQKSYSNTITISVIKENGDNTICCDQIVKISGQPKPIVGDTYVSSAKITYLWQEIDSNNKWSTIPDAANSKDFTPKKQTRGAQRNGIYRRLTYEKGNIIPVDVSNAVSITYDWTNLFGKQMPTLDEATEQQIAIFGETTKGQNKLLLYPNPTQNLLKLKTDFDLNNLKITIIDITGKIYPVDLDKSNSTKNNKLTVNVSSFPAGLYYLSIFNGSLKVIQKSFIKE